MKLFFSFFLALAAASAGAQAATLSLSTPGVPNLFLNRYSLDSFKVASDTNVLAGLGEITSGSVAINESTHELRLTLQRHMVCPEGQLCVQMMPVPTVLVLPIETLRHDSCGGTMIVAERSHEEVVGGARTRIEVLDANGASLACPGGGDNATFVKRVKVIVTEMSAPGESEISVLSGFPQR